jgi:hypothetical protein
MGEETKRDLLEALEVDLMRGLAWEKHLGTAVGMRVGMGLEWGLGVGMEMEAGQGLAPPVCWALELVTLRLP